MAGLRETIQPPEVATIEDLVAIAHFAAHYAYESILANTLKTLGDTGFVLDHNPELMQRLHFFHLFKISSAVSYSSTAEFSELLVRFDGLFTKNYLTLKGKKTTITFYDWMYMREKITFQMGLSLLYSHLKLSFEAISGSLDDISFPKNFSLVRFQTELFELFRANAMQYPLTVQEKKVVDAQIKGRNIEKFEVIAEKNKLNKPKIHTLFYENSLTTFSRDLSAFIRKVESLVMIEPVIAAQGPRVHHEPLQLKIEEANWTAETRAAKGPYADSSGTSSSVAPLVWTQSTAQTTVSTSPPPSGLTDQHDMNEASYSQQEFFTQEQSHSPVRAALKRSAVQPTPPGSPPAAFTSNIKSRRSADKALSMVTVDDVAKRLEAAGKVVKSGLQADPLKDLIGNSLSPVRSIVGMRNTADASTILSSQNNVPLRRSSRTVDTKAVQEEVQSAKKARQATPTIVEKTIAGPRAGASKVSPIDESDDDLFDSSEDETSNRLKITVNKKQNFPAKLVTKIPPAPAERGPAVGRQGLGVGRRVWTLEEETAILEGYEIYKEVQDKWKRIREDPRFSHILRHRTNVDLKDKHRNFLRNVNK